MMRVMETESPTVGAPRLAGGMVALCLALLTSGCEVKDPLFCQSSADCAGNSAGSYCDLTGEYEPNHIKNTCVPSPFDAMPDSAPDAQTAFTLDITFGGASGGYVLITPGTEMCTDSCTKMYPAGTDVQLFGSGGSASKFAGFGGDCVGSSCSLTMDQDHSVGLTFVPSACTPNSTACDTGTNIFTRCDSIGEVAETYACPLGCNANQPRCNDVNPSNGLAAALDAYDALSTSQQLDLALPDGAVIDTTAKTVKDSNGNAISVPTMTRTQTSAPDIFVLMVKSATIGNVVVKGSRALAIVSDGDITIQGVLQADAVNDLFGGKQWPGPGSVANCDGSSGTQGNGVASGGGGGGHSVQGAHGGRGGAVAGGTGSNGQADATGVPLRGGCQGGTGAGGIGGGWAGGAVQLVSRTKVGIGSTGVISANGAGGGVFPLATCTPTTGSACLGAGGGGAGGVVLLEAPSVTVGSAAVVVANGGGGGCSDNLGQPGNRSAVPATGCAPSLGGSGGAGGAGSTAPQPGVDSSSYGGGGGGAYGRVRVNSAQTFSQGGATVSPSVSLGTLPKR